VITRLTEWREWRGQRQTIGGCGKPLTLIYQRDGSFSFGSTPPSRCAKRSAVIYYCHCHSLTHLRAVPISDLDQVSSLLLLHFSQAPPYHDSRRFVTAGMREIHRFRSSVASPSDKAKGWRLHPTTQGTLCEVRCNEGVQHPVSSKSAWRPISVEPGEMQHTV